MIPLTLTKPRGRIIDRLRAAYPGRWTYDPGAREWHHENGSYVGARACLAPQHPADDDTYEVRYYLYRPGEYTELVLL